MKKEDSDKKPLVSVTPTFLLRGIEPIKVLNDYLQGKFSQVTLPNSKIQISSSSITLAPQYGNNGDSETYVYQHKINDHTIVTTNHDKYILSKGSDPHELPKGGCCLWCRQNIEISPVGIPVKIEKVFTNAKYHFYVDQPYYCRFECCFSGLKRDNPCCNIFRDPLYADSEQMLKLMFNILYPGKGPLKEAHDWRLLKENNGPMPKEEYYSNTHCYYRTPNIIISPVKIEYLVSKN